MKMLNCHKIVQTIGVRYDVAIAGGGIIGLSIANAILDSAPNLRVVVIEKEKAFGLHASGRNSGVLHAGFYYSPDSLKAKFCRDGNQEIRELSEKHKFEVNNVGKVVVARDESEFSQLTKLYERGLANGVQLELLPASQLHHYEPKAKTFEGFLWSPSTAIADPSRVIQSIRNELVSKNVVFAFDSAVKVIKDQTIEVNNEKINARHFVNAAGSNSDRLAHAFDVGKEFLMVPFMGIYKLGSNSELNLKRLVYPVPHKINPFLGVHLTLTLDGKVKIGPTAIPILGREQYSIRDLPSLQDLLTTSKGLISIARGEMHQLGKMVKSEYQNVFEKRLIALASELVPELKNIDNWSRKPPGIRAQLVNLKNGELVQDFIVKAGANSTHILNTVSPGWTSSIPFAKYIATNFVLPSLN